MYAMARGFLNRSCPAHLVGPQGSLFRLLKIDSKHDSGRGFALVQQQPSLPPTGLFLGLASNSGYMMKKLYKQPLPVPESTFEEYTRAYIQDLSAKVDVSQMKLYQSAQKGNRIFRCQLDVDAFRVIKGTSLALFNTRYRDSAAPDVLTNQTGEYPAQVLAFCEATVRLHDGTTRAVHLSVVQWLHTSSELGGVFVLQLQQGPLPVGQQQLDAIPTSLMTAPLHYLRKDASRLLVIRGKPF